MLTLVVSCSVQMNFIGNYSPHFSSKEKNEIRHHLDPHGEMKEMIIGGIVVNDSLKIGLYKCIVYKQASSVNAIHKVLKFKEKVVFYSKDMDANEKHLNEFNVEYKKLFTVDELKSIRDSFMKGIEVSGRLL